MAITNTPLDIREGDILVDTDGNEYPIRDCQDHRRSVSVTVPTIFNEVAYSTKRSPAVTGGKRGVATTHLSSITGSRMQPLGVGTRAQFQRVGLETPHELWRVNVYGTNVRHQLIVEELKR